MKITVSAVKSGRAWNGSHRDSGVIIHAVEPLPPHSGGDWFSKALCGAEPGRRGNGWAESNNQINCPKCLKKQLQLFVNLSTNLSIKLNPNMKKFARLFDLPDGAQVLLYVVFNDEDNTYELKFITDLDGILAEIIAGYQTRERAIEALEKYTLEAAQKFHNNLLEATNNTQP
jgi:hypothetical protein